MTSDPHSSRQSRIAGGLYGLLVGDALGVPYEFHPPEDLPALEHIDMVPPTGFRRAHPSQPPGSWSDDGSQALCLLASLLHRGELDLQDFSNRMVRWMHEGYLTSTGHMFDIGIQTSAALRTLAAGADPETAGPRGERDNGNGSLMRVLPLVLWHTGSDAELIRDAHRQSLPTHAHPRSLVCCALYCLWGRRIRQDHESPWDDAVSTLHEHYASSDERLLTELTGRVLVDWEPGGTGYVLDTLHTAHHCVEAGESYADVVRRAVAFGHDTDTTACVAGGIAGLIHGVDGIPREWREMLVGREQVEELLAKLLD